MPTDPHPRRHTLLTAAGAASLMLLLTGALAASPAAGLDQPRDPRSPTAATTTPTDAPSTSTRAPADATASTSSPGRSVGGPTPSADDLPCPTPSSATATAETSAEQGPGQPSRGPTATSTTPSPTTPTAPDLATVSGSCGPSGDTGTDPTPAASPTTGTDTEPSGQQLPTGDLPGWKQIFSDDFTTPAPAGSFLSAYGDRWSAYDDFPDTTGVGAYAASALSVHDGVLDLHVGDVNGTATSAAPIPLINGKDGAWGQTYGRYSVRFKADPLTGMHLAWLLWPDDDSGPDRGWNHGEIDFPEGDLTSTINAFDHCVGDPTLNCLAQDTGVGVSSGWHTATTEWTPAGVTLFLDRTQVATSATSPSVPMHWVLQTETAARPTAAGDVNIDWVSIWTRS